MRKLINCHIRYNTELTKILRDYKQLGGGSSRQTYDLGDGTVMKLPEFTRSYTRMRGRWLFNHYRFQRYLNEINLFISDDIDEMMNKYLDPAVDDFEYMYGECVCQSLEEAYLAQSVGKNDFLLPMIECGFFECGIFYSIFPKVDVVMEDFPMEPNWYEVYDDEIEWLLHHLQINSTKFWRNLARFEALYSIKLEDCFDNTTNYGIWKGKIVCFDYGLSSSSALDES